MSGTIGGTLAFKHIPANVRVPGTYIEVDPSNANSGQQNLRTLIIGQVLAGSPAASGTLGVPVISQGAAHAKSRAGAGSMLALMVAQYRNRDTTGELWVLPLADDGSGNAAAGSILFAGTATAAGTYPLYIDGQLVSVAVPVGMTAAQLAAAVNLAITPSGYTIDLPVTSAVSTATVTLTAKNKGLVGNDIDIRTAYRGTQGGEAVPDGITTTITAMSGGTVNPILTAPLLALTDMPFEVIICPYTDSASLDAIKALMDDNTGRWSYNRKLYGHVYSAKRADLAASTTFGVTRNDQHVTVLPMKSCPINPARIAADYAAAVMESVRVDPALPLGRMVTNILAPAPADRFVFSDRNTLLFDGLSTYTVQQDGTVLTERLVTTYQANAAGVPDTSYLDAETMHTLGFVCRDLDYYLSSRFARVKLVGDDVRIPGGSALVNPRLIRSTLNTRYRYLQDTFQVVQDADGFARDSSAQIAGLGRVNILAPIRIAGQLRIMAILVQFTKPT